MDADMIQIVIFLVVAVVLLIRLKGVLGTKTGHENTDRVFRVTPEAAVDTKSSVTTNAVDLKPKKKPLSDEELHMYVSAGSTQEKELREILANDPAFDPKEFLEGAKYAYEMLLTAFVDGDTHTLKQYASQPVYEGFLQVIKDRENAGQTVDSKFIGIRDARMTEVDYEKETRTANITVRFVAERTYAVRDKMGEVVEGDLIETRRISDQWTFTRRTNSTDPNWILTATS